MKNLLAVSTLALALAAAGCGSSNSSGSGSGSGSSSTPSSSSVPAPAGNVAVDIKGFAFVPKDLTVKKGTQIEWENYDSAAHNVTSDDGSFKSPTLNKGDKYKFTADKTGTFNYVCTFHANMTATLTVTG